MIRLLIHFCLFAQVISIDWNIRAIDRISLDVFIRPSIGTIPNFIMFYGNTTYNLKSELLENVLTIFTSVESIVTHFYMWDFEQFYQKHLKDKKSSSFMQTPLGFMFDEPERFKEYQIKEVKFRAVYGNEEYWDLHTYIRVDESLWTQTAFNWFSLNSTARKGCYNTEQCEKFKHLFICREYPWSRFWHSECICGGRKKWCAEHHS